MDYKNISLKKDLCGESPLWDERDGSLCWTDIVGCTLNRFKPETSKITTAKMPGQVGCISPRRGCGFMAAMTNKILVLDDDFNIEKVMCEVDFPASPSRFNDGKNDRTGSFFWVGDMYMPRDNAAAGMWRISRDGTAKRMLGDVTTLNGIAWSPDGSVMYASDSWNNIIWAFDYDPAVGEISNQRQFYKSTSEQGRPDGAAVDTEGHYWFAGFGGSRLVRLSPTGTVDREVKVPMTCPTMLSFGGPDYRELFVTSFSNAAAIPEVANDPFAGIVISLDVGFQGLPESHF